MKKLPVLLFAFVVSAAIAVPVASRTEAETVSDSYHLFSARQSAMSGSGNDIYEGPLALDLCYSSIDSAVISSNPDGTGPIVVDDYIKVNGQFPCGTACFNGNSGATLEAGHDITEFHDPIAPVNVKDILVNGTNEFALWDGIGINGNTELYLVVSGTPCNQPPVCDNATPSNDLWSPNHKLVSVSVLGVTDPDGDPVTITIDSVYQDEVLNGLGDGNTAPDAVINGSTAELRAERDGTANGRIYYVNFTASDGKGGTCSGTVEVGVNHDQGKKGEALGEGPLYPQPEESVAPGNSGNNPGHGGNPPGQDKNQDSVAPGNSGNAHDNNGNNPGNSGNPPGQDKNQDKGKSNEEHGKKN
jgi:hypothetical protein